jgi:benzodiazapine receptor
MSRSFAVLASFLGLCLGTGYVGSTVTAPSVRDWYPSLLRPPGTPPDWVFAPVWTTIFILMAIAAWLVWRQVGWFLARWALMAFGVQLVLNLFWSVLFFGMRSPGPAFSEIVLLWFSILTTLLLFWRHNAAAGLLLTPYLAWVSFAAYLNFGIWQLNY